MNLIVNDWAAPAGQLAIAATALSAVSLLLLHPLSPDFDPSWRMVSEYANGRYSWLLAVVFSAWSISSFALLVALWPLPATTAGRFGLFFLALAGVGQAMGALFDINHPLHGPAAMIGIPSLCIAAVLITPAVARTGAGVLPLWTAHLPWISFALMLGTLGLFFSNLRTAGVDMAGRTTPLAALPEGVVGGYAGWANRLLFVSSYVWTALASCAVLKARVCC